MRPQVQLRRTLRTFHRAVNVFALVQYNDMEALLSGASNTLSVDGLRTIAWTPGCPTGTHAAGSVMSNEVAKLIGKEFVLHGLANRCSRSDAAPTERQLNSIERWLTVSRLGCNLAAARTPRLPRKQGSPRAESWGRIVPERDFSLAERFA